LRRDPSNRLGGPDARRAVGARHFAEVVLHLARREAAAKHRFTVLGWMWPLARQLAQLIVLVFVFSRLVPLGVSNFPAFVFSGLIGWTWFTSGIAAATTSLVSNRHLVFQSRFPLPVVPVVAVAVPLLDVLIALPVLLILLVVGGDVSATFLLLPVILLVQGLLMCGIAWIVAALYVYLRDLQNMVGLALLLLFYLTPVFYDRSRVPERFQSILLLNPMTSLVEAYRAVTLQGQLPDPIGLGTLAAVGIVVAFAGYALFKRLQGGFADEL
jgi:lipopolysaccharide transport system permease protein